MDFVVNLEYNASIPPFRRLSDALRKAILDGRLAPGNPLPSVRDLSTSLHLSRATVLKALDDLKHQGYVETSKGSSSIVSKRMPGDLPELIANVRAVGAHLLKSKRLVKLSAYGQRLMAGASKEPLSVHLPQINFGGPPIELTPITQWKRLMLDQSRLTNIEKIAYAIEPFGYASLREAIAAYLHRFRAVRCDADRVVVFASKQLRLDCVARVLINPGDPVAFEEPGYPEAREALRSLGAKVISVPVDRHGLMVDQLLAGSQKFKMVYVTPSHHDPTGVTLSLERRFRLLKWAKHTGAFIIEDDYDSEYRYGSMPLPSLQGLDHGDCVIYLGSLWKVLFQIVRFGYIVIPRCLRQVIWQAKMQLERHMPALEQVALTEFINDGHLERHTKKSQPVYARRRQALIHALTRHMGQKIQIRKESAGMHVLAHVQTPLSDEEVAICAAEAEMSIMSTRSYYAGTPRQGEFIIPFADISEDFIEARARRWSALMLEKETVRSQS